MPKRLLEQVQAVIDAHPEWDHIKAEETAYSGVLHNVNVHDDRTFWIEEDHLRRAVSTALAAAFPALRIDSTDSVYRVHTPETTLIRAVRDVIDTHPEWGHDLEVRPIYHADHSLLSVNVCHLATYFIYDDALLESMREAFHVKYPLSATVSDPDRVIRIYPSRGLYPAARI